MTQEQGRLLKSVPPGSWAVQVWIGKGPDGLWHVSLDRTTALCGAQLERKLMYDRWPSLFDDCTGYLARNPDGCPQCDAVLQAIAEVVLSALDGDGQTTEGRGDGDDAEGAQDQDGRVREGVPRPQCG